MLIALPRLLDIDAESVNDDIRLHIQETISNDSRLQRWSEVIQHEIVDTLTSKAGEMFRWADCQLRALKKCKTQKELRNTLRSLPATLDETYLRILDNIDSASAGHAHRMLTWLCFSSHPLTVDEAIEALAVDPIELFYDPTDKIENPEDILSICGSLVACNNGVLRLAHHSVKEYLMSQRILDTRHSSYFIADISAHESIGKTCLIYLKQCSTWFQDRVFTRETLPPLAEYALNYWSSHYKAAGRPHALSLLALEMLEHRESNFFQWAFLAGVLPRGPQQQIVHEEEPSRGLSSQSVQLYYAALVDSPHLISAILDRGADIDVKGGYIGTALVVAAYKGSLECVEVLLSRGADVNVKVEHYGNALHAATSGGWLEIMRLLVAHKADVDAISGYHHTALHAAVSFLQSYETDANAPR